MDWTPTINTNEDFSADVAAVGLIDVVPKILNVICRTTGMGFSAVARVTESRWVACAVRDEIAFGLKPGGELDIGTTICDEIQKSGELVVIDDAHADEQFKCHPTPRRYGFRSYISVPIRLDGGHFFGTLCAIDPAPALVSKPETVEMFKLFAGLIASHLDTHRRLAASETALLSERETAQLREEFIAVLGHDLRNPLGAVRSGAEVLARLADNPAAGKVRDMIHRSVGRMTDLIDSVLDFARGRLGGGISLKLATDDRLGETLNQVVHELQAAPPDRDIVADIRAGRPFACNRARLGQMLSNLLGNAVTHGDPGGPVRVAARVDAGVFELSVDNRGKTIPAKVIDHLFKPFSRGSAAPGQQGLGLGLYIASEVAKAHGGTLAAESAEGVTKFTFRMPVGAG
ncbi:GAF domain-containing sensor histidine kinase [Zavarzinella formosa]|uniref:GAF domain-containing sensor histidine kinase n=1 Tax=Zavarzinella formosa TaxID=360055 RepID=UPI00031A1EA2|nr:GAF domain-containing sensor histidine kinase [Zavarzinella formosa]